MVGGVAVVTLIEKLEGATEGSRELDAEIHVAVGGTEFTVPYYTTSIDAALTLVPEGRARRTIYLPCGFWPYRVWVYRDAHRPLEQDSGAPVLGRTEALALCIAALRARLP